MNPIRIFLAKPRYQFWILQIFGWLGYFALNFSAMLADGKPWHYVYYSLSVSGIGLVVTSVLRLGYRRLWNMPTSRMATVAAIMLVVAEIVDTKLYTEVLFNFCDDCRPHNIWGYIWYFASRLYVLLSWSGLYFGIKLTRQLQQQKEAALKAQSMAHEAQLKMLRYQLNPHFLFNTLNAISTLVLDNRNSVANGMIGSLSAFLRYSLDSDPVQRVTPGAGNRCDQSLSGHRAITFRRSAESDDGHQHRSASGAGAEFDFAAAHRKFDQARGRQTRKRRRPGNRSTSRRRQSSHRPA